MAVILFAAFVNFLLLRVSCEDIELSFGKVVADITVSNLDFVSFTLLVVRSCEVGFNLAQDKQHVAQWLDLYC